MEPRMPVLLDDNRMMTAFGQERADSRASGSAADDKDIAMRPRFERLNLVNLRQSVSRPSFAKGEDAEYLYESQCPPKAGRIKP